MSATQYGTDPRSSDQDGTVAEPTGHVINLERFRAMRELLRLEAMFAAGLVPDDEPPSRRAA